MLTEKEKRFIESTPTRNIKCLIGCIALLIVSILLLPTWTNLGLNIAERSGKFNIPKDMREYLVNKQLRDNLSGLSTGIFVGLMLGFYLCDKKWLRIANKLSSSQK